MSKPVCQYDGHCYRKNPEHFEKELHPTQFPPHGVPPSSSTAAVVGSKRPRDEEEGEDVSPSAPPRPAAAASSTGILCSPAAAEGLVIRDYGTKFVRPSTVVEPGGGGDKEQQLQLRDWVTFNSSVCALNAVDAKILGAVGPQKLAIFDMDDTLVKPKDGRVHAQSATDWEWLTPDVPKKLKELHSNGYRLVIISNQGGVANKGESKANEIKNKICTLNRSVGVPISALFACEDDENRKPLPTMLQLFAARMLPPGQSIDFAKSFYCGDAAGRCMTTLAGRKKDFSCSDRKFAYNTGLPFMTPEEWLLKSKPCASFDWGGFGPEELKAFSANKLDREDFSAAGGKQEMVLMCGFPGSGKSTFFRRYLQPKGYFWINRDTLKKKEKCIAAADAQMKAGKSVCIDNTNPSWTDREEYAKIAKKYGCQCRAFYFEANRAVSNHLNLIRAQLGIAEKVPGMGYNMFQSKFSVPDVKKESLLAEVVRIPMVPNFEGLPPEVKTLFFQLT